MQPMIMYERSEKGPYLYIRHGITCYNSFCNTCPKNLAKVKGEYIDSHLSEEGSNQAEKCGLNLLNIKLKYVFCSPMYRCLETCLLSLKNHPERENFIVLIHPFITEIVSGVHDYSRNIKEKKKIYNENSQVKFDWSTFDSFYPEEINKEFFYLNFVNNYASLEEKIKVENMIMRIKENHENFSQVDEMLVEFTNYFESLNKRPETLKSMFERNLKFKDYLKNNFILENDEKVLVFTHSAFTKISTSKIAYNMQEIDDYPKDSYRPENCEIITIYL